MAVNSCVCEGGRTNASAEKSQLRENLGMGGGEYWDCMGATIIPPINSILPIPPMTKGGLPSDIQGTRGGCLL